MIGFTLPASGQTLQNPPIAAKENENGPETGSSVGPALAIAIEADADRVSAAGEVVHFSLTIFNKGNAPLTDVTVGDATQGIVCERSGGPAIVRLEPGAKEQCESLYLASQADFDGNGSGSGKIEYAVSAQAGGDAAATRESIEIGLEIKPELTLEQSQSFTLDNGTAAAADRGDVIAFIYVVTNSGNVTIDDVHVDVDRETGETFAMAGRETLIDDAPPFNDSSDDHPNDGKWRVLAPGDTVIFAATYTVQQSDMDARW